MNLSPVGVVGPVWDVEGRKSTAEGFLSGTPAVDSPESLPPAGDPSAARLCSDTGRGGTSLQAAGGLVAGGAWEPGLQVQPPASAPWICKNVPLPRFPHLSSESQWRGGWGDASSLRTWSALRRGAGEAGWSLAVLEQCSDMRSGVDLGTFSSPACPLPSLPFLLPGVLQVTLLRAQVKSETQGSDHRHPGGTSVCKRVHEHE